MANTPPPFTPPTTPTTPASGTSTCQWCSKPMTSDAIRCPSCGKLRKDIYNEKIICYLFSLSGGICFAVSFATWKKKQNMGDFNNYFGEGGGGGGGSNNTLSIVLLVMGIIAAALTTYYYLRVSKKMKTYMWM